MKPIPVNDGRMVELTSDMIHSVKSVFGGWSRPQVELMGVKWPLKRGWIHEILGNKISVSNWERVVELKNQHLRRKLKGNAQLTEGP